MNTQTPVKVTANDQGQVVIANTNKPEYGYIRLEQTKATFANGFLNRQKLSALIAGRLEDLESMGFEEGQELPGKLVVEETITPGYEGQDPKINPETGEVLEKDGKPIYRNVSYTTDMNAHDVFIQHDKVMQDSNASQEKEESAEAPSLTS